MFQVTPAATFCATLVDSWVALGMTDAIICPGSRSTPMALALDAHPTLRTHVHHDERSGAFLALGLGKATLRPAAVLTTSGTAAVNLHPAVAEAGEAAVPLLALTADRPPELHGVGAPQTLDQQDLFGSSVRRFVDAGVPDDTDPSTWRDLASAVYAACLAPVPGPVQLDLPFREPLTGAPGGMPGRRPAQWVAETTDRPSGSSWDELIRALTDARVLVVAGGDCNGALVTELATARGWAILADPRSRIVVPNGVAHFDSLLRDDSFAQSVAPEVVLRFGPLPVSKVLGSWLDGLDVPQFGIEQWGRRFDPGGSLTAVFAASDPQVCAALADQIPSGGGGADRIRWSNADALAAEVIDAATSAGTLTEPAVARIASRTWLGPIQVSSSMPVRDLEWYGVRRGQAVLANRGVNGIDGVVSTAVGVAAATRDHVLCLIGDVAFLHDHNGLLGLAGRELDLTVVVVDNDGGGIFGFLPQATELDDRRFEHLFGTPHGLDLVAVASAAGVAAERVATVDDLQSALEQRAARGGVGVVVAPTDRASNASVHAEIHARVSEGLARTRLV